MLIVKIKSKNKKLIAILALCLVLIPVLSGCAFFENAEIEIKQSTIGLPLQISTYDFNGQKIDEIKTSKAKTLEFFLETVDGDTVVISKHDYEQLRDCICNVTIC